MVPRLWPTSTFLLLASGPSLCNEDLATVAAQSHVKTLTINSTCHVFPDTDVIFAPDPKWWIWNPTAVELVGFKYGLGQQGQFDARVTALDWTGTEGLERSPDAVRTGGHGGYAAINLAVHLGASQIILLGYDLAPSPVTGQHHHHADHPDRSHPNYAYRRAVYHTLVQPLADRGVVVLNASRWTTIDAFPCMSLIEALALCHPVGTTH